MNEKAKLKKSRAVTRTAITKCLNRIKTEFDTYSVQDLSENLEYLEEMFIELKNLDFKIQELIDDEAEYDTEIQTTFDYNEKIILLRSRINVKVKELSEPESNNTVNQQTISNSNTQRELYNNSTNVTNANSVRLPKLNIEKYYGDPCLWIEFINKFENSIEKNSSLSKIDKFAYLKSLLGGAASNAIRGFALSEENYNKALKLLKERFGKEELVINAHMSKLLNLYPVKNSNNVTGLRKLYDICEIQIRSLESLNITAGMFGHLLQPILLKLLPEDLVIEFNRKHLAQTTEIKFDVMELLNFLKIEIECRETSIFLRSRGDRKKFVNNDFKDNRPKQGGSNENRDKHYTKDKNSWNNNSKTHEYVAAVIDKQCLYCNNKHSSDTCEELTINDKKDILKKQGRCFLCLEPNHRIKDCRKREMCSICNKKHNRSICYQSEIKTTELNVENKIISAVSHCNDLKNKDTESARSSVLLQTCTVCIRASNNDKKPKTVRLLLDNGSMRSFITKEVSQLLKLPIIRKETLSVYSFGSKQAIENTYNVVKLKIENRNEPTLNIEIEALETERITATDLPTPNRDIVKINKQLKSLQLADCYEIKNEKIVILIGADYYYDVVTSRIKRLNDKLVATETLFGWCLQGKTDMVNEILEMKIIVEEKAISDQLTKFWDLENLGVEMGNAENKFDDEVMEKFEEGITFSNSRYKVKLPWKPGMKEKLVNNKEIALKRFLNLKSKFQNDPLLYTEYKAVINEYKNENIIEKVTGQEEERNEPIFYLPHRAVIRNDKSTSKLRIVFDASSHGKGKLSLNDCLHVGLNLLPDIFCLLSRFRENKIVITADIKQAFLQIQIEERDRDVTRFFWQEGEDNLEVYRMTRVLFGVTSSPFLLSATIKHHLKRYVEIYPSTSEILNNSLYVDDLITGAQSIETALKISLESCKIFKDASMILRKWQTNSIELRDKWKELGMDIGQTIEPQMQTFIPSKVLGVAWNPDNDIFYFDTENLENFLSKRSNTKRYLLQAAGRIFDPVGFIGPYVIRIKVLIQELWCLGLDWDELFPVKLSEVFNQWCEEIPELNSLAVPRYYLGNASYDEIDNIQMHSFSDSSIRAYGTVVYLRIVLKNKKVLTSFVASKSRVAPLKTISLPRLELMSALLSARLSDKISKALNSNMSQYFWTDSSITYFWIKGYPDRFKPFVKNRVQEIQKFTDPKDWRHCPGKDNPADLISRGISASELRNSNLWWHGPDWLIKSENVWPQNLKLSKEPDVEQIEKYEIRKKVTVNSTTVDLCAKNDFIEKYSSFDKLIRITALCLRFINNCKTDISNRKKDNLNVSELRIAAKVLIRSVQQSEFKSEIKNLQSHRQVSKSSKLLSLNPFLDEENLLRVGGRLKFSKLSTNQKHQLLLPKSHHLTNLIIEHFHKISLHSGTQTTLFLIRQLYWIPSGQDRVRRILSKCITCFRARNHTVNQMMGDLPRDRVVPSRPFEKVGIDFAGPIITKPNLKRSRVTLKSYIAIFVCFSTKATHFEVVSDLTSESFLASLRRFIARRSKPSIIWSDNATNFKGAKNILNSLLHLCKSEPIQRFVLAEGIEWNFIPPASPHFGGLWEANIGSMKRILLKITRGTVLCFEELSTLVTQIEAVLNSRPLCPLSADPNDFQSLTPGHFLVGAPLLAIPEPNEYATNLSLSSRWSLIQSLRSSFWERWSKEYLSHLQSRAKWHQPQPNIQKGQLVLLKDDRRKPMEWRLGRIKEIFPGSDQLVRVVEVTDGTGSFKRSISGVCPLPFSQGVGPPSNGRRDVPDGTGNPRPEEKEKNYYLLNAKDGACAPTSFRGERE